MTEELESIISRWEEPRVFEQQLPELSPNEQLLIIGIGSAAAVAAGVLAALVLIPPPAATTPRPSPTPTPSPSPGPPPSPSPTSAVNVSFSVTASDSEDPYLRYWTLIVDGQIIGHETHVSGDTMTASVTLQPGNHTLTIEISQTGGPSYGTYSGTAVVNGQSHPFSGVDSSNSASVPFTV